MRTNKWIALIIIIPVCIAIMILSLRVSKKSEDISQLNITNEDLVQQESQTSTIHYSEEVEGSDYNYITNAHTIEREFSALPYDFYLDLGDKTDTYMKENGYTKTELIVSKAKRMSGSIKVTFTDNTGKDILLLKYSPTTDMWEYSFLDQDI